MTDKYADMADEELIAGLRDDNKDGHADKNGVKAPEEPVGKTQDSADIEEFLLEKYKPLVRRIARTDSLKISGGDYDDLLQEGMIGLMKAVKSFDPEKGASFFTFAALCIRRQMISAVEASNRDKNAALNSYISLYDVPPDMDDEEGRRLIDSLKELSTRSVEEIIIDIDAARELNRKIHDSLSPFEARVYEMYTSGMSYTEIAEVIGKEQKSVDNAIQRIKSKIRKVIE
ncbi:MAG: sigma-70 family RNA polymerase sigma factor [Lachnospiraceae bacterium]|nr:sigma-70 family RNA polymerase sigma factor [Lachnospiraceae bacterium]